MFNFLKSNKKFEPLDYELRKYFEHNLLWLTYEFPEPKIEERRILLPVESDFPIQWENGKENVNDTLKIICENMQIDPDEIEIDYYHNGIKEINTGSSSIFIESDPESPEVAGLFHAEKVNGKYRISLDQNLIQKPDSLIATLAHELAHVKLLGEKRLEVNDEMLTDFTTVFFGLGIFNANSSFKFQRQSDRWEYSKLGYLTNSEWAYSLALFAYIRQEENPEWKCHLNPTTKKYFEKCLRYMFDNEEEIFRLDDE